MTESLLEVSDLRVDFRHDGQLVRAVDGLTYSMDRGRTMAVIGESGSGKTVSARAIMGLLPPTATVTGSIRFDDVEMVGLPEKAMRSHRGCGVAMVFQDPTRSLNPDDADRGADPRGDPDPREGLAREPPTTVRSSCSSSCGCPLRGSGSSSIRISCRAGCASA